MTTQLTINAAQYSAAGTKPANEDACGIRIPEGQLLNNKGIAIVIADGVSSAEAGREAAEACVKGFLADYFSTPESWTVKTAGQKVLGALNRWLYSQGHSALGVSQGLLTTCSVLILKSTTAHLFHVGDSRIWRLRGNELLCLTRDHQTWLGKEKRFLNRAMGGDVSVEIDYRNEPLEVGDCFLLTTDGIHEFINEKTLRDICLQYREQPEQGVRELVNRALNAGSTDNVTAQLLCITQLPDQNANEFYQQLCELPFPPPLEAGQILDGYKILRELHASKRSQLYLAEDSSNGQQVVIKTPSINFNDDAEYIDGFLHEEWAGRRINSPHVLKVIEPSKPRRFLYYVIEYIQGQTLAQWIHDQPQPDLVTVRNIISQLISGVRAFHRLEMLHQDLKPDNILIDQNGTVKIIDFGSTRIAGIQEIHSPIKRGQLLGTYDYAAPEYFEGYNGSQQSDLYSIGVICYEMLTRQLPYGGPLNARNLDKVSYHPARHQNRDIPAWVDGALEKATQIRPHHRYSVMSEFLADLTRPNPDLIKQNQPLLQRNPIAFWRGLAVLMMVLNVVLLFLWVKGR